MNPDTSLSAGVQRNPCNYEDFGHSQQVAAGCPSHLPPEHRRDDIEVASEFYRTMLGFEQAANADGPMDYRAVDLASFARDAGFDDGRVSLDVRFLTHTEMGIYLELFTCRYPKGDQTIHRRNTNDLGGIRHLAVEVPDAVAAYEFIRVQQQAYGRRDLHIEILGQNHTPEEITPFPYKFFY